MNDKNRYESALASRNASPAMQGVWSPQRKFAVWRRLWLALAQSERELGLDIPQQAVDQMSEHLDDIDFAAAAEYEKKLRHDVMAHVHTFADVAPVARPIIHLGATSQFVNCNTDLLLIREALQLIAGKLAAVIDALGAFAAAHRDLPTLAFTHFQPAQPTTVGKRAAGWAYDLALTLAEIEHRIESLRFRGVKGATGSQASFLALFENAGCSCEQAHEKVEQLDRLVAEKMGWDPEKRFVVTGQTYPRVVDGLVVSSLAAVAAVCAKFAADMRLLANRKELEEPFEAHQIGSSAMPYKRNPMRCERISALSRFVVGQTQIPFVTAAEQWLERTLDDSACRRLTLPEPFLALDGVLDLMLNVSRGVVVYEKTIARNLAAEMPFMASENLLMAAVQKGADRQDMHEIIRRHAQEAAACVKAQGADNDLIDRLKGETVFRDVDLAAVLDARQFVGRAPQQVDFLVEQVVQPIRKRYAHVRVEAPDLTV